MTKNQSDGRKSAFTLAEVLIALTVLGIIASLTIPTVIQKQREAANRTKIKKAMSTYEQIIENIKITQNIQEIEAINSYVKNDDNCSNGKQFFKINKDLGNCKFSTMDGLYWDISTITSTIVALNEKSLNAVNAKNADDTSAFYFHTLIKCGIKVLSTNNMQSIITADEKNHINKLLYYVKMIDKKVVYTQSKMSCNGSYYCTVDKKENGKWTERVLYSSDGSGKLEGHEKYEYDENGNKIKTTESRCDNDGNCKIFRVTKFDTNETSSCNGTWHCTTDKREDGKWTERILYSVEGDKLEGYEQYKYDDKGNKIETTESSCDSNGKCRVFRVTKYNPETGITEKSACNGSWYCTIDTSVNGVWTKRILYSVDGTTPYGYYENGTSGKIILYNEETSKDVKPWGDGVIRNHTVDVEEWGGGINRNYKYDAC